MDHSTALGRLYSSWSHALVGAFSLEVRDIGSTPLFTITYNTERFWHGNYATTGILSFRSQIKTDLDAGDTLTWTVTFDNNTMAYTFSVPSAGRILFCNNALTQQVLGFSSTTKVVNLSGASDNTPIYLMPFQTDGQQVDGAQERDVTPIASASTDDGINHGFSGSSPAYTMQWRHTFEPKESVRPFYASGTDYANWTWQDVFEHMRIHEDGILRNDTGSDTDYASDDVDFRFRLTGDGAAPTFEMAEPNRDVLWHIPFDATILERFK